MHSEKITITKENKFGDRYTIERDYLVYDDDRERLDALIYNRTHKDSYSNYCRKQMDSTMHVKVSQIMDSIDEYFSMLDNLH